MNGDGLRRAVSRFRSNHNIKRLIGHAHLPAMSLRLFPPPASFLTSLTGEIMPFLAFHVYFWEYSGGGSSNFAIYVFPQVVTRHHTHARYVISYHTISLYTHIYLYTPIASSVWGIGGCGKGFHSLGWVVQSSLLGQRKRAPFVSFFYGIDDLRVHPNIRYLQQCVSLVYIHSSPSARGSWCRCSPNSGTAKRQDDKTDASG